MFDPKVTQIAYEDLAMGRVDYVILRSDGYYPNGTYYTIDVPAFISPFGLVSPRFGCRHAGAIFYVNACYATGSITFLPSMRILSFAPYSQHTV